LVRFPGPGKPEQSTWKTGLKKERLKEGSVSENGSNGRGEPETISAPENADGGSHFFDKDEGEIAVTNAGLILLHPFLKPFFKTLGITDEHGNITEARSHLAVQLVHYV